MMLVARMPLVLAALLVGGCATAAADSRPLTDVEREALIREQQTAALRRDVGVDASARAGCAQSSSSSRLNARRSDYQGADSFDSRGCAEPSSPGGRKPIAPTPAKPAP